MFQVEIGNNLKKKLYNKVWIKMNLTKFGFMTHNMILGNICQNSEFCD